MKIWLPVSEPLLQIRRLVGKRPVQALLQDGPTSWYNGDESPLTAFKWTCEQVYPMPTGAPDGDGRVMAQRLAALTPANYPQ